MARNYDKSAIPSVYNLLEVPPLRDDGGFRQVVFRGIDQMVALTEIDPEMEAEDVHKHPWEQTNVLVEGRLELLVGDERVSLKPYDALTVPPHVPHAARAVDNWRATLLAFWPLREDLLSGTEYQREFRL